MQFELREGTRGQPALSQRTAAAGAEESKAFGKAGKASVAVLAKNKQPAAAVVKLDG